MLRAKFLIWKPLAAILRANKRVQIYEFDWKVQHHIIQLIPLLINNLEKFNLIFQLEVAFNKKHSTWKKKKLKILKPEQVKKRESE